MLIEQTSLLTVLIVEDDRCARALLTLILERTGYRIIIAEDGLEGLEAFGCYHPDIVITDIKMPYMNGIEMIRHIRSLDGEASQTPIIVLTASDGDLLAEARTAGADIVGCKPGDVRRVPAMIEDLCHSQYARYADAI